MSGKKRFAQVGVGGRSMMYSGAIAGEYAEWCEMVACCDNNEGRLKLRLDWFKERGIEAKGYLDRDFDKMIEETKPDCVIVTTKDCEHDRFIVRAMELGCDAITEKPMTIDENKCQRIVDTRRSTGEKLTATLHHARRLRTF